MEVITPTLSGRAIYIPPRGPVENDDADWEGKSAAE